MRTAWMVVVVASLTGCNLLFRADGKATAADGPVAIDAPPQNPDQPVLSSPGIDGVPHVDDVPVNVFATVRGQPNRAVTFSAETVQGAELGNFVVSASSVVLDDTGLGRIEVPWQATGFGNVKARLRAVYDMMPLEQGNAIETDFKTRLDVGNYNLGGNTTLFSLAADTLHGFLLRFPEAGRIVSVGILTEGLAGGQVAFALYTSSSNQPKDLIAATTTNPVSIAAPRIETTLDHSIGANEQLFLTINLSTATKLRHSAPAQGSVVIFGGNVNTLFPDFTSVFPIEGNFNGDAFAVYATIEPP